MADKIPLILTIITLAVVIIFNIASLSVTDWYVQKNNGNSVTVTTDYGLVAFKQCTKAGGSTNCNTKNYDDVNTDNWKDSAKKDLQQTQAGGGLTILFLILNLILCVVLILLCVIVLLGVMIVVTKNPMVVSKLIWIPLLSIPLQLVALFWWTVLFGYYDDMDDADTATIGSGIGLLIITILLPIIIFLINKFVLKQSTSPVQA